MSPTERASSFGKRAAVSLAVVLSLAYVIGLILDRPDWLRGLKWVWERHALASFSWRTAFLFVALLVGGVLFHAAARKDWPRRQAALFLATLALLTVGVQIAVAAQHHAQPLAVPFWSSSGFFLEGVRISDPVQFLQEHTQAMPHYRDVHVRTQPPGWPLSFWAVSRLLGHFPDAAEPLGHWFRRYDCLAFDLQGLTLTQIASPILLMSFLLISGLGVLPLYFLGKQLFSQRIAQISALFYPFLPAYLAFQARVDVVYAVICLTSLWLLAEILLNERRRLILPLGLLLGIATFWGYGLLAVVLLLNLFMLVYLALRFFKPDGIVHPLSWLIHPILTVNGAILAVILLLWGALWLAWEVNGLAMFQLSQQLHRELRINYPVWSVFNLYETAVFMGIPVAVGCIIGVVCALRQAARQPMVSDHLRGSGLAFMLAWGLALLLLNLSGQVRAETGRLWTFLFAPGLLVGVAGWYYLLVARRQPANGKSVPLGLYMVFLVFVVQALAVGYFLGGRAPASTVPGPMWRMPPTAVSLDYQLGSTIRLNGYEAQVTTDELLVTLYWQAAERPPEDYSVFVHMLGPDGTTLSQSDSRPKGGALPTWCWVPGEVVADEHRLSLTAEQRAAQAGSLAVGLYNWRDGTRLSVLPPVANDVIQLPIHAR